MICDQSGAHVCDKQLFDDVDSLLAEIDKQKSEQKAKRDSEKESA